MALAINVGGVWKNPTPKINVAGTWKTPDSVHINVGGVWKKIWEGITFTITNGTAQGGDASSPYSATVGWYFNRDGTIDRLQMSSRTQWNSSTNWVIPNSATIGDNYQVRLTVQSGVSPNIGGLSANTWYTMSVDRQFSYRRTTVGIGTGTWLFEIRDASTLTVVASGNLNVFIENGLL